MRAPDDVENFPLFALGPVDRDRRYMAYAAKLTYQLTPDHRVDASFFGDPSVASLGPQRDDGRALLTQEATKFSRLEFGGNQQTVRYSGIMNNDWLLEGSWARAAADFTEIPPIDEWETNDQTVTPNIRTGGIGFSEDTVSSNIQYQIKSTNHVGAHQIRYGFQYEDISYDAINQRTGPTIILADGTPTVTGVSRQIISDPVFGQIYRANRGSTDNVNNAGEIPLDTRGSGFDTVNGFTGSADFQYGLDVHVDYRFNIGDTQGLTLIADLFNTFNQQAVLRYNEWVDLNFQVPDPDFRRAREYGAPFRLRFGVRYEF